GSASAAGAFPEDEAGISAYINTGQTINIENVSQIYTEVLEVGDNYIIGKTPISDYGGNINVHVYADTDGWIVAYFLNGTPASYMMQWLEAPNVNNPVITTITNTTLVDAVHKAGDAAGVDIVSSEIKYYDFSHPNANSMMLFIRTRATNGVNLHQVEIPADYTLYEASYYHYIYYRSYNDYSSYRYWDSKLKVDGTTVSDAYTYATPFGYRWWRSLGPYEGTIATGDLHTIEISYERTHSASYDYGSAGVATVLIYRDDS
ncbi:MAG: hypothetical protein K8S27_11665, partial [Candidatus Omnitrophica bacterium]|nr:hypothetical protein [Candidatus Omnitrophota bacterium]